MSSDPTHPHGEHGHSHGHTHGRPGDPAASPPPVPPPQAHTDDAGAVALSEALKSSFFIVRILLAALLVYFLVSNVNSIGSQERALVLRFGKPLERAGQIEQGPGLVWAFPYPIDEVVRIPVSQLLTVRSTVGWYPVTPAQEEAGIVPDAGGSLNPLEGYAISGDGNIVHARAIVRYRITEPVKFYLNHTDGASLMTNFVDNAVMFAVAQYRVDDALRRDVAGLKELVLKRVRDLVQAHDLGVTVEPSDLVTQPPRQLKAEFDLVLTAEQDRAKSMSDAQGYANRVVNEAMGQARARVNSGETERNRLVQAVSSEAQSFSQLLPEYQKNPDFFRQRLQTETLRRILTNAQQKFTLPSMQARDQLWLHLNRDPEKPARPAQPTP